MAVMDAAAAAVSVSSAQRSPGFLHAALHCQQSAQRHLTASLHFEFQNPSASRPAHPPAPPAAPTPTPSPTAKPKQAHAHAARAPLSRPPRPASRCAALHSSLLLFLPKAAAAWIACWPLLFLLLCLSPTVSRRRSGREEERSRMGGSGKWVKSLIGLKKPDKEDCCKVRGEREIGVLGFFAGNSSPFLPAVFFLFLFCFNLDDSCLSRCRRLNLFFFFSF